MSMCGIVGLVVEPSAGHDLDAAIRAMNETLRHRGPDEDGVAVFPAAALAMRRLSIVDLSGGQQPMWDERRELCIVFNGEIYDHTALRDELIERGHRFVSDHSDTEVLIHGYEEWGGDLFPRLNGMFALAIWDLRNNRLVVARDRMGKKPLYIARVRDGYAVASELKAFFAHPGFEAELDPIALDQYLAFDYVVGPRTMLRDVQQLPAGHWGTITPAGIETHRYWTLTFGSTEASESELIEELDARLDEAVQRRMVADVPVGVFLSGGLDSTTVAYYMRRHSDDVHSFSIAYDDPRIDESHYAELASRHLGTTHHVETVTFDRIEGVVERMPSLLDTPMGDPSFIPTYLLSEFTKRSVTVALGGDASDEFLMGYNLYRSLRKLWVADYVPAVAQSGVAALAGRINGRGGPFAGGARLLARELAHSPEQRVLRMLGAFEGRGRDVLAPALRESLPASPFAGGVEEHVGHFDGPRTAANRTIAAYVQAYLIEDMLVKVDRASMAASLEVRTPFLDPDVVELMCRLPVSMKLRGPGGKYLLRRLMRGRIPDPILDRDKQGFSAPLGEWLRGPLVPLVRDTLEATRLSAVGLLDAASVQQLVDEHLSGHRDHARRLWLLLQFELWRERWLAARTAVAA